MGVLLGVIMLPVVALMTGDWMLAAVVAFAVLAASTIGQLVACPAGRSTLIDDAVLPQTDQTLPAFKLSR